MNLNNKAVTQKRLHSPNIKYFNNNNIKKAAIYIF